MPKYSIVTREVTEFAYEVEATSLEEAKQNFSHGIEGWADTISVEIINWEELGD